MATIEDLVREMGREVRDSLRNLDEQERRARSDVEAASVRVQTAETERVELRAVLEHARTRRQEILGRIADLQRTIELERRDLEEAEGKLRDVEEKGGQIRKSVQGAEQARQESKRCIQEIEQHRIRARKELVAAHRGALKRCLADLRYRLRQIATQHGERDAAMRSLEALRSRRHDDPEVASLCEKREAWTRVLEREQLPDVRETAREKIKDIEGRIEALFPCALAAERAGGTQQEIEELPYLRRGDRQARIFLPIETKTWQSLADGVSQQDESDAVSLIFSLAKALRERLKLWELVADPVADAVALDAEFHLEIGEQEVEVRLDDRVDVAFLLVPVPTQLEEALRDESSPP